MRKRKCLWDQRVKDGCLRLDQNMTAVRSSGPENKKAISSSHMLTRHLTLTKEWIRIEGNKWSESLLLILKSKGFDHTPLNTICKLYEWSPQIMQLADEWCAINVSSVTGKMQKK